MSRCETNARLRDPITVRSTLSGLSTYYYYAFGFSWIIFYPFPIIKLSSFYLITSPVPTCLVHNCETSWRLFYPHLLSPLSQDQIPFDPHHRNVGGQWNSGGLCFCITSGFFCKALRCCGCGSEVNLVGLWKETCEEQLVSELPTQVVHLWRLFSDSDSSWSRGVGLSQQDRRAQSSILFWRVCSFCRVRSLSHRRGQQVISTSPFSQLILGL